MTLAYPFFYRPMYDVIEDGWTAFSCESEFSRVSHVSSEWRLSSVNKNFEVRSRGHVVTWFPVAEKRAGRNFSNRPVPSTAVNGELDSELNSTAVLDASLKIFGQIRTKRMRAGAASLIWGRPLEQSQGKELFCT